MKKQNLTNSQLQKDNVDDCYGKVLSHGCYNHMLQIWKSWTFSLFTDEAVIAWFNFKNKDWLWLIQLECLRFFKISNILAEEIKMFEMETTAAGVDWRVSESKNELGLNIIICKQHHFQMQAWFIFFIFILHFVFYPIKVIGVYLLLCLQSFYKKSDTTRINKVMIIHWSEFLSYWILGNRTQSLKIAALYCFSIGKCFFVSPV